jgi:hypothetical protein
MSGFEKKVSLTGDRGFESFSLQRRVFCEPDFLWSALTGHFGCLRERIATSASRRLISAGLSPPVLKTIGLKAQEADINNSDLRGETPRQKASTPLWTALRGLKMSREQDNKAIVGRWFDGFWGNPWKPEIIDELAAPDMLLQYSLHAPRRGRDDVRNFMMQFRVAFPDLNFWGVAELIAEGDYVVGRWEGGGTHTGPAFSDFLLGSPFESS